MGKCPECGKAIDTLTNHQEVVKTWEFKLLDGEPDYTEGDCEANDTGDFYCPECHVLLCSSEDEATKILEAD